MAQTVAVVRGTLPTTASGTVDLTSSGFGTPSAAIIIANNGNTTNSTEVNAIQSIGFWDGSSQVCNSVMSEDNVGTSNVQSDIQTTYGMEFVETSGSLSTFTVSNITDGIRLTMATDNTTLARYVTVILLAGISAKAGTIQGAGSVSGTRTSVSLGFAPKLILFSCNGHNFTGIGNNSAFAVGVADINGAHHCSVIFQRNAQATSSWTSSFSNTYIQHNSNNNIDGEFTITNWGSDDFTLTNQVDNDNAYNVFLALGGADLSYDLGGEVTKTTTGTQAYTTTIQPAALLLVLNQSTSVDTFNDSSENESQSIGISDGTNDYCHAVAGGDALGTTNEQSMSHTDRVMDLDSESSGFSALIDASVDSFNATDFTLNYSAVSGSAHRFWWVAFADGGGGGGITYVQLERDVRGMSRGIYTGGIN